MLNTLNRITPRGTWISATSPFFFPNSPWPIGLVVRIRFWSGSSWPGPTSSKSSSSSMSRSLTLTLDPNTTVSLGSWLGSMITALASLVRKQVDLGLEQPLVLAGGVVLGVLAQVPEVARRGHPLGHLDHLDVVQVLSSALSFSYPSRVIGMRSSAIVVSQWSVLQWSANQRPTGRLTR